MNRLPMPHPFTVWATLLALVALFTIVLPGLAKGEPGWSPEFRDRMQTSCLMQWAGQPKVEEVCPCFVKGVEASGVTEQEALDFFYSPAPAPSDPKVHEVGVRVLAVCVEKHLGVTTL